MLNYIRSECYRSLRIQNLKVAVGVLLGMIFLLIGALVYFGKMDATFPYANTEFALGNLYNQMTYLFVVMVFLSMLIDDSECKNHTMKHSVAFGIKRDTIYLGRFFVQLVICTVIYITMTITLTGVSFLFLEHSQVGEVGHLLRISLGGYSCLLAGLAIAFYFIMKFENQSVAIAWALIALVIVPITCNIIGRKIELVHKIASFLPYNLITYEGPLVDLQGNVVATVAGVTMVGLLWMLLFLWIGVNDFRKKELK